jgi:hypothetical protein
MANQRLPNQRDIDSQILDLPEPMRLFWGLVLVMTIFIFAGSFLALCGAMSAGFVAWAVWPYVALPMALWAVLLALPVIWLARRGALSILEALAMTAEAWMARAGYSVDLNNDGYIGTVQPQPLLPEAIEEIRPIIVRNGESRLLALQQTTIPEIAGGLKAQGDEPQTRLQMRRRVWELPKLDRLQAPLKVPQETLEDFIDGIFTNGIGRDNWVTKKMDRDTYDSLIALLELYRLLAGRKPGSAGKLTVTSSRRARMVLGLPVGEAGSN